MSARDFVLQQLRANPNLTYAEVRDLASTAGLTVAPFLYGSMRRQLGLPPKVDAAATGGKSRGSDDALSDADLAEAEDRIAGDQVAGDQVAGDTGDEPEPGRDDADAGEPDASPDDQPLMKEPLTNDFTMAMLGQTRARGRETRDDSNGGNARTDATADPTGDMPADARAGAADAAPGREPKSSGFKFAVDALRLSPDLPYQDLKARAKLAGLSVPPIVYGRAKALLGLVPTKPRRSKGDAPRALRQVDSAIDLSAPLKALPAGASESLRQLEQMIQTVRELEAENRHLRNALQAALTITSAALEEIE